MTDAGNAPISEANLHHNELTIVKKGKNFLATLDI